MLCVLNPFCAMNFPLSSFLKLLFILLISIFLAFSLLSANFYDPTFFNQISPVAGVQNWCGVVGALIGGTLVELFGPASFLIPWFILKISYSSKSPIRRIATTYHAMILLLFLSMGQALWWPAHFAELPDSTFLRFSGYAGILGVQWILKFFHPMGATILVAAIILFCTIKLFEELPIKLVLSGVLNIGILFPFYLLQSFWQKFILFNQWILERFSFFRSKPPVQLPSPFAPEHLPDTAVINEQMASSEINSEY